MELFNTHCHSGYCGHGEGEIEEYAKAANDAGLKLLAFTDHFPLTERFDPDGYLSIPFEDLQSYKDAVLAAREAHPEMEILLGTELDYLGASDDRDLADDDLAEFDIVLGSVHFVDEWPFDDPAQRGRWDEDGAADEIWKRYVELWCELAADDASPVTVLSHPDLAKKFNRYPSYDLDPLYSKMAEAARAGGKAIEVNTSGVTYACKEMFPAPALLRKFYEAGVPATLGSDAHEPRFVARGLREGAALLREAGYDHASIPIRGSGYREFALD